MTGARIAARDRDRHPDESKGSVALVVAAMVFVANLSVAQPLAVLLERLNNPLPTGRESALQGIAAVGQLDVDLAKIVAERRHG